MFLSLCVVILSQQQQHPNAQMMEDRSRVLEQIHYAPLYRNKSRLMEHIRFSQTLKNKSKVLKELRSFDRNQLKKKTPPRPLSTGEGLEILFKTILYALFRFTTFMLYFSLVHVLPLIVFLMLRALVRNKKK